MWLKYSLSSKNCFFTLISAIFFEPAITRTPDNSNLFSISLEGSSYRESTVVFCNIGAKWVDWNQRRLNLTSTFCPASSSSGLSGFKHRHLNDCSLPFQPSSVNQQIVTLSFTDIDANNELLWFVQRQETRGPTLFLRGLITWVRKTGKVDWVREVLCYNGDHFL